MPRVKSLSEGVLLPTSIHLVVLGIKPSVFVSNLLIFPPSVAVGKSPKNHSVFEASPLLNFSSDPLKNTSNFCSLGFTS